MEDKPGINSALSRLPDSVLIDLGEKWISDKATHTRSLAAFSIVVNRHFTRRNNISTEISDVVKSMFHIGKLYLSSFHKFDQAYRYLSIVRRLAQDHNLIHRLPYIDINLANIWEINTMIFPESSHNGLPYVAEAWEYAIIDENENLLPAIAINMAIISYSRKDSICFSQQMSHFLAMTPKDKKSREHEFADSFIAGIKAWLAGYHDAA